MLLILFAACGGGGDGGSAPIPPAVETTSPTIDSTNPANRSVGVPITTAIAATFSEPINTATIGASTFIVKDSGNTPVAGTLTYSDRTATVIPFTNLAYSTTYTAIITTDVKDLAGNAMTNNHTWSFTTGTAFFRTTLATDNFNRADNADVGSFWDAGYTNIDKHPAAIESQQVRAIAVNSSDPKSAESYNAVTPANDQWCQITLGMWTGSEDRELGCTLRAHAPPTTSWYWCYARANGARNAAIVNHHTGGVGDTNLASDFSVVWAAGDKLRCEVQGTTLRLYRIPSGTTTETLLLSTSDGEWTSGRVGLLLWMNTGGDLSHAAVDDFAMGGFSTTPQ